MCVSNDGTNAIFTSNMQSGLLYLDKSARFQTILRVELFSWIKKQLKDGRWNTLKESRLPKGFY